MAFCKAAQVRHCTIQEDGDAGGGLELCSVEHGLGRRASRDGTVLPTPCLHHQGPKRKGGIIMVFLRICQLYPREGNSGCNSASISPFDPVDALYLGHTVLEVPGHEEL